MVKRVSCKGNLIWIECESTNFAELLTPAIAHICFCTAESAGDDELAKKWSRVMKLHREKVKRYKDGF